LNLRTLLVHGARSVFLAAHRQQRTGHPLDHLRLWALQCERGSVRGVAKPITIVALEAYPTVGSTPADLMMSRAALLTPLTYKTNTRLQPFPLFTDPRLTEESIPDC